MSDKNLEQDFDQLVINPHNSTMEQSEHHTRRFQSTAYSSSPSFVDRRLLSRSGIIYTGSPSGITIDMFLFQVDMIAASRGLSDQMLLFELHTILKDVALQWYWTYRKHNPSATWVDLRNGMIERFKDRRTNYEIKRMVESRKQQPSESFLDFYNHVWTLTLQCQTPYTDEELIQILMTNMKPALQYHLTDRQFNSINELIKSCAAWEESFKRFKTPLDPAAFSRRTINELTDGLYDDYGLYNSYEDSTQTDVLPVNSVYAIQTFDRVPATDLRQLERQIPPDNSRPAVNRNTNYNARNIVCFNCSDLGHTFVDCRLAPVGLFCYKCGLKGTITPRCRRCAENQNAQRKMPENPNSGSWRAGIREPPQNAPRQNQEDAASNTDAELRRQSITVTKRDT